MNTNDERINKSLRFSFLDGIFASGMLGFTQDYLTPFLLILGATAKEVGILNSLPNLFASLIQLKAADFSDKLKSRKKIFSISIFLQALMLLPMALIGFLAIKKPIIFIVTVILFSSFGAFANSAWASLMSDLVEQGRRGQYFGWRNKTLGFIVVMATFIAGLILHLMKRVNIFYGFTVVFLLAFIFRIISWYFLKKMHEPVLDYRRENYFNFFEFLLRLKESNFAKFVLFVASLNFCVNLASPFFSVLMLKDLHFSYMLYTIISVTATLTVYSMMGRWGKIGDKVGNLRIMKFCAPLIAIIPLLWIVNRNPIFLIFAQVLSGFAWAGFNLCASNFIFDAVRPEKRTRCISYFSAVNGMALCLGALLGGFLVNKLPNIFGYRILTLFLISGILRLTVALFMPQKLKEVRAVEHISTDQLFFNIVGFK
ncbi:MAG: MFS transporter [Candidatus Omnitrophota bacterium]